MISNIGSKCIAPKVLNFPALLSSGKKPVKVWADKGMVWFDDDNREKKTYLEPIEALDRVVTLVTDYTPYMAESPSKFQVDRSVLLRFVSDFKDDVYEEALRQRYGEQYTTKVSMAGIR